MIVLVLIFNAQAFAKNDVLDFYNKITKKCSEGKENFPDELVKLDEIIKTNAARASKEKTEQLFRDENLSSDVYSYLGTELLSDDSDLRGLKACGKHYAQFIKFYKEKLTKESSQEFEFWQSCLESDYKEIVPEIAKKIISCYNSRTLDQVKSKVEKF